jgi:hypothetical protein
LHYVHRVYYLSLGYCPVLSNNFVMQVTKALPNLETVDFEGAYDRITTESVVRFLEYESLLHINLKWVFSFASWVTSGISNFLPGAAQ